MEGQSSIFCEDREATCYFCRPTTHQIKIVLKCTFRRLKFLNSKIKHGGRSNQGSCAQESSAVQRLLKMLFEKQQFQLALSRHCRHLPLVKFLFRGRLSCSHAEVQRLIDDLCDLIARRDYELEVTTMQVKNAEESVGDLENLLQEPPEQGEREMQSAQMSDRAQIKIEENRPTAVANEITTPSQPNNNNELAYQSAPSPYNILLFGSMYYQ